MFRLFGKDARDARDLEWARNLDEQDFEELRRHTILGHKQLWQRGFYNALRDVLSDQAVRKIKDQGNLFHLIEENPNAAEWGLFWLRHLRLGDDENLVTIPNGVGTIIERIEHELRTKWVARANLSLGQEVTSLDHGRALGSVEVGVIDRTSRPARPYRLTADHVVLALPQSALLKLSGPPRNHESQLQLSDELFCPLVDEDREVRGRLLTTVDDVVAHRDDLLFPNV